MADLDDLYREIILDHYKNPRNSGSIESPPALVEEGFNPLCGDEVKLYLVIEDDRIADIRISGQGCSISRSSASLMSQAVKGKPISEAFDVLARFRRMMGIDGEESGEPEVADVRSLGELAALQGVVKFPVRIKCATLPWNTLSAAIARSLG